MRHVFIDEMPQRIGDIRRMSPGSLMRTGDYQVFALSDDRRSLEEVRRVSRDAADPEVLPTGIKRIILHDGVYSDTLYERRPDGQVEQIAITYGRGEVIKVGNRYEYYVHHSETPPRPPAEGELSRRTRDMMTELDIKRLNRDLRSLPPEGRVVLKEARLA